MSFSFLTLPASNKGSANIRYAASTAPDTALYAKPEPSKKPGNNRLAT
jgi:hypothetical protein